MTKARDLANVEARTTLTDTQTLTNKTLTSPVLGGTTTTASGNLAVQPATYVLEVKGGGSTEGAVQLNCAVNTHGQIIKSQPHAQSASNTLLLPGGTTIGNSNAVLVSDTGTQTLTNKTITSSILTGTLTAGGSVGTNGQFLQSTGTGVQYATPAAGGGMTLLQTVTLSGASVTSSSFSGSSYKRIFMHIHKGVNSSLAELRMRLNGDTGSNYSLQGGSSEGSTNYAAGTSGSSFVTLGFIGTTTTLNQITSGIATIDNPSNTDTVFTNSVAIGFDGSLLRQLKYSGMYKGTAAITSITFFPDNGTFTSGSISIYGVN